VRQASRREELLDHAVRLFAAHGYSQVGVEDIGQAVGIAGPSVYNHWPNKLDLLITPVLRGASALAMDMNTAYRVADTAEDVLRWLVRSYGTRSRTHHDLFSLLITDIEHLPESERHAARRAQHDYVVEWAHLLRLRDPAVDANSAQIRVHAALSVANDTARSQRLRRNPAVLPAVEAICANLLSLPPAT
jgi:AcrR family transcriptional regulator